MTLPARSPNGKSGDQFKAAALLRLDDARALLKAKRFLGALYCGGYAVEMTLKWALNDAAGQSHVPREDNGSRWHDFDFLLSGASFRRALLQEAEISKYWSAVIQWKPAWRYETVLPSDFRRNTSRAVENWLESVANLVAWLNGRHHDL